MVFSNSFSDIALENFIQTRVDFHTGTHMENFQEDMLRTNERIDGFEKATEATKQIERKKSKDLVSLTNLSSGSPDERWMVERSK